MCGLTFTCAPASRLFHRQIGYCCRHAFVGSTMGSGPRHVNSGEGAMAGAGAPASPVRHGRMGAAEGARPPGASPKSAAPQAQRAGIPQPRAQPWAGAGRAPAACRAALFCPFRAQTGGGGASPGLRPGLRNGAPLALKGGGAPRASAPAGGGGVSPLGRNSGRAARRTRRRGRPRYTAAQPPGPIRASTGQPARIACQGAQSTF